MEQNSSQASCHATVRAKTSVSVNCQRYALLHKREPRMLRLDLLPCILRDSVMWTNGPCFRAAICLLFPHLKSRTLRRSQCSLNAIRTCFCNTWEHKLNMNSTSEDRQLRERGHCRRALVTFLCRERVVTYSECVCVAIVIRHAKHVGHIIQGLSKRYEHLLLWPPRSPDLTPCDFFLWGYVKDNAYKSQTARSHSSCGANLWRGTS